MDYDQSGNPENEEKQFYICDKILENNSIFQQNMEMQTGEKPFKCSICENSFLGATILNEHMEIHTLDKPFQSISISCEDAYANHTTLTNDMAHAEETFQCNICGKPFFMQ